MSYHTTIDSPIGRLLLAGDGESLQRVHMQDSGHPFAPPPDSRADASPFAEPTRQLEQYFAGERRRFELPLEPAGTDWERRVWAALVEIPYGTTVSYGEIADRLCTVAAARAVGRANHRNPIALIIPCHRVIGASGSLTGYGGGLERKRYLLDLEAGRLPLAV
jgi:methylated-DNA-[protein]-cysteine S-methyltransferase